MLKGLVLAGVFVLGVVGCSGEPGPRESSAPLDARESGVRLAEELGSPFSDVVVSLLGDVPADAASVARRAADVTAACMAELGFDYVAHVPAVATGMAADEEIDDEPEHGTRGYAEQRGFGVAWSMLYAVPEEGYTQEELLEVGAATDPNLAYRLTLSTSEQAAFDDALLGDGDDVPVPDVPTPDMVDRGCAGEGLDAAAPAVALNHDPEFVALMRLTDDLDARAGAVSAVRDALRGWQECVAQEGVPAVETPHLLEVHYANLGRDPGDRAAVEAALSDEVAAAVVSWDCDHEHGYTRAFTQARYEAEVAIVAENEGAIVEVVSRYRVER